MPKLVLDTDVGNDIDDLIALILLSVLHKQGAISLEGILTSKRHRLCAPYCEQFTKYLGCQYKIGAGNPDEGPVHRTGYLSNYWLLREQFRELNLTGVDDFQSADYVLENILRVNTDGIVFVGIGLSTNLARFLRNPAQAKVYNERVTKTVLMAGDFSRDKPEFNVSQDIQSFQTVLDNITGEVVFVGHEIGRNIAIRPEWFWNLFQSGDLKPLWLAYVSSKPKAVSQFCHDAATVLYASGHFKQLFKLSSPGQVHLEGKVTKFSPHEDGNHRIVVCDEHTFPTILHEIERLVLQSVSDPKQ